MTGALGVLIAGLMAWKVHTGCFMGQNKIHTQPLQEHLGLETNHVLYSKFGATIVKYFYYGRELKAKVGSLSWPIFQPELVFKASFQDWLSG